MTGFHHRQMMARMRPKNRGPVPCGHFRCNCSFKNENAAEQHRRDTHPAHWDQTDHPPTLEQYDE